MGSATEIYWYQIYCIIIRKGLYHLTSAVSHTWLCTLWFYDLIQNLPVITEKQAFFYAKYPLLFLLLVSWKKNPSWFGADFTTSQVKLMEPLAYHGDIEVEFLYLFFASVIIFTLHTFSIMLFHYLNFHFAIHVHYIITYHDCELVS